MFTNIFVHSELNADRETLYRIETIDSIKCDFLHIFKNVNEESISVSNTSFLQNVLTIIGPNGHFMTSEAEIVSNILKNYGVKNIINITILKCFNYNYSNYDPLLEAIYESINEVKQVTINEKYQIKDIPDLDLYIKENNITLSDELKEFYREKGLNTLELFDLLQANSEHCRHHVFNGKFILDDVEEPVTLMRLIKCTNNYDDNNQSLVAFRDNASAIIGFNSTVFNLCLDNLHFKVNPVNMPLHLTSNAETHNFPTSICPFPGAATGTGGRIRDTISIGKGGKMLSGFCGYYVGDVNSFDKTKYPYKLPYETLIQASNGCSDYGNKIGEPVLGGFARSFKFIYNDEHFEYVKPLLYSAGNGLITNNNLEKYIPNKKDIDPTNKILVVRLGGKAFSIGLGGGSCSSKSQSASTYNEDFNAVQRGNPEMENRLVRIIETLSEYNIILSIHDQGSGGMANVTKEIISPCGANIFLDKVTLGDTTMNDFQIWNSEYQEQCSILIYEKDLEKVSFFSKREEVPMDVVGCLNDSGVIQVYSKNDPNKRVLKFDLNEIENIPQKTIHIPAEQLKNKGIVKITKDIFDFIPINYLYNDLKNVFRDTSVGSKRFLVHKVDRSVGGLVSHQPCVGPWNTPLADYSISHLDFVNYHGVATSFGERPYLGLMSVYAMVTMSIGEMLTNLIFSGADYDSIKCQGNWMWSSGYKNYDYHLLNAVKHVTNLLCQLKIGIDGGKDSLSMNYTFNDKKIISPNSFVIKSYAKVKDSRIAVEPYFKKPYSDILYINLGKLHKKRMGGSSYYYTYNNLNNGEPPKFDNEIISDFKHFWEAIRYGMREKFILSGHDISDGGFITSLIEMSIASFYGMDINIKSNFTMQQYMFNEELGLIIEIKNTNTREFMSYIRDNFPTIEIKFLGKTRIDTNINIFYNGSEIMASDIKKMKIHYEQSSFYFESKQMDKKLAEMEYTSCHKRYTFNYYVSFNIEDLKTINVTKNSPIAIVLRDIGSNSDKELRACLTLAGFKVYDFTTSEFITAIKMEHDEIVNNAKFLAFCGGFSRSDIFGAAVGWYHSLTQHASVRKFLDNYYNDPNKYSIGICNGCQLMSQLGWIPKCKIIQNDSKKFESRFPMLKVNDSSCRTSFTKGMKDTLFGMNSAHGEGKIVLDTYNDKIMAINVPFFYTNDYEIVTEDYPFNPNGSKHGIAALNSDNGNHLAIMPHPERTFLMSQCQYLPYSFKKDEYHYSPWFKLFINIYYKINE